MHRMENLGKVEIRWTRHGDRVQAVFKTASHPYGVGCIIDKEEAKEVRILRDPNSVWATLFGQQNGRVGMVQPFVYEKPCW